MNMADGSGLQQYGNIILAHRSGTVCCLYRKYPVCRPALMCVTPHLLALALFKRCYVKRPEISAVICVEFRQPPSEQQRDRMEEGGRGQDRRDTAERCT